MDTLLEYIDFDISLFKESKLVLIGTLFLLIVVYKYINYKLNWLF